jgi:hypothetical protein
VSPFKRSNQPLHLDRQGAVIVLRKPGQNRSPDRAISGDLTTGATPFKTQITAQLRRPAMGIRWRWTRENPRCLPQAHHLRMGSKRQIQNGGPAMTEPSNQQELVHE